MNDQLPLYEDQPSVFDEPSANQMLKMKSNKLMFSFNIANKENKYD